jgi:multisubunit Na+/H+ antiporter MnhC subunit
MTTHIEFLFRWYWVVIPVLVVTGIYCVMVTRNLIRTIIGLEILTKAVTLLIILAGYATDHRAEAQAFAITLIVIEVVVMVAAAGIIINVFKQTNSLDSRNLRSLKG